MDIILYELIWLIIAVAVIRKDFLKEWKNYLLIILVGTVALFLADNIIIMMGLFSHNLPYKIWASPISIFPLYFIFSALVYRTARYGKNKKQFLMLSFIAGAIISFAFESTALIFGYWNYTPNKMGVAWFDALLIPQVASVPSFATFCVGMLFLLAAIFCSLVKKDFIKK